MKRIRKCTACGSYTMRETCSCGALAGIAKPAKFSPEDRYGRYRRMARKEGKKEV